MTGLNPENVHAWLLSSRNVKRLINHCDFPLLQSLAATLTDALETKQREHEEAEQQRLEREEKRRELLALITGEGFSPEELIGSKQREKSRITRPLKYQYMTDSGLKKWSGVGKMPRQIRASLDSGKSLNDFLITPATEAENHGS